MASEALTSDSLLDVWAGKTRQHRDSVLAFVDAIAAGTVVFYTPAGFTKERYLDKLRDYTKALTASLQDFGRH